ncbi:hypothetical protein PLICRDRAFT_571418 [Plicaturopsis crispa FD-325 SS-3]|nr:hypothetical protein PLICRDRAFT_571418 [Plicaturopsis crispa FD-325 SS-3]
MMREFQRSAQLTSMIKEVTSAHTVGEESARAILSHIISDKVEAHGTVAGAVNDELSLFRVQPGPVVKSISTLSQEARLGLHVYYNQTTPGRVHYALEARQTPHSRRLLESAEFFDWALLDGRRITPTSRTLRNSAGSSIVKVIYDGEPFSGEVRSIFRHNQPGIADTTVFAEVEWMKLLDLSPVEDDPWSQFPYLEVETWEYQQYWNVGAAEVPPPVVPFHAIACQLARGLVTTTEPHMWITTTMERHTNSLANEDTIL